MTVKKKLTFNGIKHFEKGKKNYYKYNNHFFISFF